ncbi:MAG: Fic/DOC family N-terminal domain-containing protein [Syntrophobacteraceae bacterium]
MIGNANSAPARYDGILSSIVNSGVLLSPLTTQESVLSSRIEGTQATLE